MPPVELPDAETVVGAYLRTRLDGVHVAVKVPNPRPATFVRAWRTGGRATSRARDEVQITCQTWGPDTVTAAALAGRVRDLMLRAATSDGIPLARAVTAISGPYYDPDPISGTARYSQTLQLVLRATRTTQTAPEP